MQQISQTVLLLCCLLDFGRSEVLRTSSMCLEHHQDEGISSSHSHVFREGTPLLSSRSDLTKIGPPDDDHIHEVIFVIRSRNMDELTRIVDDVSDPKSVNYGQHMTSDQLVELTSSPESAAAVSAYLHANGASVVSVTPGHEYVTAQAPISVWDSLFNTRFHIFQQMQSNGDVIELVRAEQYWISREIHSHVLAVMNTIEMPVVLQRGQSHSVDAGSTKDRRLVIPGLLHDQLITPARLRIYYNMSNSQGNSLSSQVVFANPDGYFSPLCLRYFQGNVSMQPYQPAIVKFNDGHGIEDPSVPEYRYSEGNLDMQYIMAMSPGSPTTFWRYNDLGISRFLRDLAMTPRPPLIVSISHAIDERYMSPAEYSIYGEWILKASAMGVTVFAASGDQGAVSHGINGDASRCGYNPVYPSSNPYTVSVGGTTGALKYGEEVVCAWNTGQVITSGGGFSNYYTRPSYQDAAVEKYFAEVARSPIQPVAGYNPYGRGYPDISFEANMYRVQHRSELSSKWGGTSGTSASTPVAAGMFSNINAARLAAGKGSIGWINPLLYAYASLFVNDVTKGNNKDGPTCPHGFYATPGWDPTTGLGSINYGKLEAVMVSLGNANSMLSYPSKNPASNGIPPPTAYPVSKPSGTPSSSPSNMPFSLPSAAPISAPTALPSINPTAPPLSVRPTMTPTTRPSSDPTALPPSVTPIMTPTIRPVSRRSVLPSAVPFVQPSVTPKKQPMSRRSVLPSAVPFVQPSVTPKKQPMSRRSVLPSAEPFVKPTVTPKKQPMSRRSVLPSAVPFVKPTVPPMKRLSASPTAPLVRPSASRSRSRRSRRPTEFKGRRLSSPPTQQENPSVKAPVAPTVMPSTRSSSSPTELKFKLEKLSMAPTVTPTKRSSHSPSKRPTVRPSAASTKTPRSRSSHTPSKRPITRPSVAPMKKPQATWTRMPQSRRRSRSLVRSLAKLLSSPSSSPSPVPSGDIQIMEPLRFSSPPLLVSSNTSADLDLPTANVTPGILSNTQESRPSKISTYIGIVAGSTVGAFTGVLAIATIFYCLYWKRRRFSPVLSRHSQSSEMDPIPAIKGDDSDMLETHDVEVRSYEL